MNLILIFNNQELPEVIEKAINSISVDYNKLIVKITDTNKLDFFSYKNTFSIKNIELISKLKLNKLVYFNFDITNKENLEIISQSKLENFFLDIYIEDKKDLEILNHIKNIKGRIDLNIINESIQEKEIIANEFDNVDYYYSEDKLIIHKIHLSKDKKDLKDYIMNDFKQSMIYQYVDKNWLLYCFGIQRFKKTNITCIKINPNEDFKTIQKWIFKSIIRNENCAECSNKISCIEKDTFFYFNEKEICLLSKEI